MTDDKVQELYTLKMIRSKLNETQEGMGKLLGVSANTYRSYELGNTFMNGSQIKRLSEISNIPIEQIRFF